MTSQQFSDGYDHGFNHGDGLQNFMSELERLGSPALTELIMARANEGRPFTCLLYGMLIPWVAEVARSLHLPSALVWSQPAAVFDIYSMVIESSLGTRAMVPLLPLNYQGSPCSVVVIFPHF